jgi:hypothetical protein
LTYRSMPILTPPSSRFLHLDPHHRCPTDAHTLLGYPLDIRWISVGYPLDPNPAPKLLPVASRTCTGVMP